MLTQQINKKLSKPPCYKCPDREPGCHGRCDKYIEWKDGYQKQKDDIYRQKKDPAKNLIIDNQKNRHEKWRKSHDTL